MGDRPVFIIDGLNLFTRSYSAYPQMSSHGYQMGGCVGFLKTLQRLCRELQPAKIYVAWEGGGSQRRRKIYSDYKMNKKPEKLNRFYEDDIPDTSENKQYQLVSLIAALKTIPVCQIYVSDCEGDDVVSFLCKGPLKEDEKIIVSSDKDMYQLLNERTRIYSLHKRKVISSQDIFEEFRIKPHNFALAKCLCGDVSDNIPGIKGFGFKTAASKFPFLGGDKEVMLQELIDYAASHSSENSSYKKVVESVDEVRRNWRLVYLDGGMLSADQTIRVENLVSTFVPRVDKMSLIKHLVKEGIGDFDTEGFLYDLSCVEGIKFLSEKN